MNKNLLIKIFAATALLLTLTLLVSGPALAAMALGSGAANGKQAALAKKDLAERRGAYKNDIEKTGFFVKIEDDRVTILDEKSYKELRYLIAKNMIVTHDDQQIEPGDLLPHSIVTLIVINAEVVEIVLQHESS